MHIARNCTMHRASTCARPGQLASLPKLSEQSEKLLSTASGFAAASAQGDCFLYCQELLMCLLVAESVKAPW